MTSGGDEVKVVGSWGSPFSTRATIALKLKGVKYEFLQETYGVKSELLLQSNPVYKKVPVLIHNGKPLAESMIIVEYVDHVWSSCSNAILPIDPYERAIARFWAPYIDDKLFPNISEIILTHTEEANAKATKQLSEALLALEEVFEKCSKGRSFFGGDAIGYLDIALGVYLSWLEAVGSIIGVKILDEENIPLLVKWADRFRSAQAVKGLMPEADELVDVANMIKEKYGSSP